MLTAWGALCSRATAGDCLESSYFKEKPLRECPAPQHSSAGLLARVGVRTEPHGALSPRLVMAPSAGPSGGPWALGRPGLGADHTHPLRVTGGEQGEAPGVQTPQC